MGNKIIRGSSLFDPVKGRNRKRRLSSHWKMKEKKLVASVRPLASEKPIGKKGRGIFMKQDQSSSHPQWAHSSLTKSEGSVEEKIIVVDCIESAVSQDGGLYGRYYVGSFRRGEGVTIAAVLRRAMLSELPGIAIVAVDIEGIKHEYCTMRGVRESMLDITCNLKEVVLAGRLASSEPVVVGFLDVTGPGIVRGGSIKLPPGLRCINPEHYIATLTQYGTLQMQVFISTGKSFLLHTSARNKQLQKYNLLPVDANFMPIKKVNFLLRPDHRQRILQEQLILEIWSNGSIHPLEGVRRAAKSVNRLFAPFETTRLKPNLLFFEFPPFSYSEQEEAYQPTPIPFTFRRRRKISMARLIDVGNLALSIKAYTYLKQNNINSLEQLVSMTPDLLRAVPTEIALEVEAHLFRLMVQSALSEGRSA